MAEEDDLAEDGGTEGEAKEKNGGLMKLGLMIGAPLVLLLGGGGAAYVLLFSGGGDEAAVAEAEASADGAEPLGEVLSALEKGPGYLMPMDRVVVSINGDDGRIIHVRLNVSLEYGDGSYAPYIEARKPWIRDQFIGFLRGLNESDIAQSDGHYRLQRELKRRANLVLDPVSVEAVLINDLFMQPA